MREIGKCVVFKEACKITLQAGKICEAIREEFFLEVKYLHA